MVTVHDQGSRKAYITHERRADLRIATTSMHILTEQASHASVIVRKDWYNPGKVLACARLRYVHRSLSGVVEVTLSDSLNAACSAEVLSAFRLLEKGSSLVILKAALEVGIQKSERPCASNCCSL